jgi:hypothetical protein
MRGWSVVLWLALLGAVALAAGPVPPDFHLVAEAGPRLPWKAVRRVEVTGTAAAFSTVAIADRGPGTGTPTGSATLSASALQCLYDEILAAGFSTATQPAFNTVQDGSYAEVTVTANGTTTRIETRSAPFAPLDRVVLRLNGIIPGAAQLHYDAITGAAALPACP